MRWLNTQKVIYLLSIFAYMWPDPSVCILYPGPHGVSELRYRSNDSTALWIPSTKGQPAEAFSFLYELSLENGTIIQSSRVTDTELHLPGLEGGKTYVLDVWEECEGQWESEHSHVCFEGANSLELLVRAAGPALDQGQSEAPLIQQGVCSCVFVCLLACFFGFIVSGFLFN